MVLIVIAVVLLTQVHPGPLSESGMVIVCRR